MEAQVQDGTRFKDEFQEEFIKGFCQMLSALNAAYSIYVISCTLQHHLFYTGGTQFLFSHGFIYFLDDQLEETPEGQDIQEHIMSIMLKGEKVLWHDLPSYDYIYLQKIEEFEEMSAYELIMHLKKRFIPMKKIVSPSVIIDNSNIKEVTDEVFEISKYGHIQGQGYKRK